jgi:ABC-type glycerol-3-phosphate transport system substrate-binding protein
VLPDRRLRHVRNSSPARAEPEQVITEMTQWTTRRRVLGIATATTLTALVAACGGGGGSAASDSKTLTYWSMWNKPEPQAQVLLKAAQEFETSTGIHVDIKWTGRKVLTNVSAGLNGGSLPDLTDQDAGELTATFGAADAAMGLNDVCAAKVTGENVTVCEVVPRTLVDRYKTKDGQPMMMPYELISSALWFNGAQLPAVAAKPPATFAQWKAVLDKEKAAGRPPLALDGSEQQYTGYWWTWSAVRHAGPGAIKRAVSDKTGAGWDDPALLAAAQDLEELAKGGYFTPSYNGSKWPAVQTGWANGENKTDFLLMGSWAPSETSPFGAKNPKKFEYRSMPYPQVENGKGNDASELSLIGFAIPKKAKQPENAKKFIEFFLNKDRLKGISTTALNLTPRADIEVPAQLADLKKQVQSAGTNVFQPDDGVNAAFPQFTTESYYPTVQKLLLGRISSADFIKTMKAATIEYWKNQG